MIDTTVKASKEKYFIQICKLVQIHAKKNASFGKPWRYNQGGSPGRGDCGGEFPPPELASPSFQKK